MIYINGRFLTQNITGVQRFAYEISVRISAFNKNVIFLVPDASLVKECYQTENVKIHEVKGFSGHLWEQITLPLYLKKIGSPVLVNLCNTAPIFYSNQIVTHHDITYVRFPKSYPLKLRLIYGFIAKKIIKNSKAVITVSEFSKGEICEHYRCDAEKIHVIYNAVNRNFIPNENLKLGSYILAVSSPNYHKNFHGLIEAFSETDLDIELKIIGSASKTFSQLDLGVNDDRVSFLGRVDDEKLIELYQCAKLFVFPSFYEGFGIPPLEAQACGCPVASSDKASMKEVLQSSAVFFDPQSKEDIKRAIRTVIDDNGINEKLRVLGSQNVSRFSWDESASKVYELISD